MAIIKYSDLSSLEQRRLIDSLVASARRKIDEQKSTQDFVDEMWRNLKLSQNALKNAKSNHERDLITEIACCDNRRRKAFLELELMKERDRQRMYDVQ
jgi:hypothetical protein